MITKIINGRVITPTEIISANVYLDGDKISAVTADDLPAAKVIDAKGLYVSPGFIDIHTHGAVNVDFTSPNGETVEENAENVLKAVHFHMTHGTTSILPTTVAASPEKIMYGLTAIEKAMEMQKFPVIAGAHLEGPYFALSMAGGQDPAFITDPIAADYEEIVDRFGSIISRWSYAPERDRDGTFCKYLVARGITPSAGHTEAIYDDMVRAREAGCKCVTHLYSCTSTITRDHGFRRLGVIECAYLWDDMDIEIIADGCHLPPTLIQLIVKLKGTDRIALVTDSLLVAGAGISEGVNGSVSFILEDGVCKLRDRSAFAGSIATTDRLVRVCTKDAGIPLVEAVKMATVNPARMIGANKGQIAPGFDADVLLFDEDINVKTVIVGGQVAHSC